jgi:hypothetical protein
MMNFKYESMTSLSYFILKIFGSICRTLYILIRPSVVITYGSLEQELDPDTQNL